MSSFTDNKQRKKEESKERKNFKLSFSEKLASERDDKGYTQEDFCKLLDISRDTLSKWENGHRLPDIEQLKRICEILDCDADYMTGKITARKHNTMKIINKTGLSETTIQLLERWNVAAFPQVSRIIDFIVQYRLHCIESNISNNDLIDRLNRFFTNQSRDLQYYPRTGKLIPDENGLERIMLDNLFFDTISTDDAAIVGINSILMDMKKEWKKTQKVSKK